MDSEVKLYINRAEDEFLLAENDMKSSTDIKIKEALGIQRDKTFFYSVISHAYYCIFYTAKAYLLSKGIKTGPPEEHKKNYKEFKKAVDSGQLDKQLLDIYEKETEKAEVLLKILFKEKRKRGIFTYNLKSEVNLPYAQESIENSKKFVSLIKFVLEKNEQT